MGEQMAFFSERSRNDQILRRFAEFHRAKPGVWVLFRAFATRARQTRERYSARAIIHRVRWEVDMETRQTDELGLKINNDFSPYYARMFQIVHPESADLFENRRLTSKERPAFEGEVVIERGSAAGEESIERFLRSLLREEVI